MNNETIKYDKIIDADYNISALFNGSEVASEAESSSGCSSFSFEEYGKFPDPNLKIREEQNEVKMFDSMLKDFESSVFIDKSNIIASTPRDSLSRKTIAKQESFGYQQPIPIRPNPQGFPPAPRYNYSNSYSPMSNFESYTDSNRQITTTTMTTTTSGTANVHYNNTNMNESSWNAYQPLPEFSDAEFSMHINKTNVKRTFSPEVASTPHAQYQLNCLLYSNMDAVDVIDQWHCYLNYCSSFEKVPKTDYQKTVGRDWNTGQKCYNESVFYEEPKEEPKEEPVLIDQVQLEAIVLEQLQKMKLMERLQQPRPPKFKPHKKSLEDFCGFCRNNGESEAVYKTHTVRDAKGRVLCPKLRVYMCTLCGKDGDEAHTAKYCPYRKIFSEEDMKRMEEERKKKKHFKKMSDDDKKFEKHVTSVRHNVYLAAAGFKPLK